jgi:PilZ domain
MPGQDDMMYLVLADRAVPYLLAKVRWPDVAQAITVGNPDWLEDPGLFDLPYEPSAVSVSFPQAASVAAGWGRQLDAEAAGNVPSFIRRMPANWSDLAPVERRALGIEFLGRPRASARRIRRLRSSQEKTAASSAVVQANAYVGVLAGAEDSQRAGAGGPAANGRSQATGTTGGGPRSPAAERRRRARVRIDGQAHIRCGHATMSAGLVDLSEGGVQCVLPESPAQFAPGEALHGPFLLEAETVRARICLDVAGRIRWHRSAGDVTYFGVAFGELTEGEIEGVQWFLTAASGRRGYR